MKKFIYNRSHKIIHWGCAFDSLLEFKYAISVEKDYEFLRTRISIYYDPVSLRPTDYIRLCTKRYTPDFLIRHKVTKQAFLVEIKPRSFTDIDLLALRKKVAENYIAWKGYDWNFIIVFDDEIQLSPEQQKIFDSCRPLVNKSERKIWFQKYNKLFDRSAPSFLRTVPSNCQVHFVMFGIYRERKKNLLE